MSNLLTIAVTNFSPTYVSQTAAFGDGANDIEMMEHAGFGIAMGNASEDLKEVASWIAPPVDQDGLDIGIKHVLSIVKT